MQNMIEKILRMKIYDSTYWKEHCFALTAEAVVDKAVAINSLGGTFGGARKPTKFVCLLLKLLQLQPDKEIIIEFIKNEDYKYVRVLGMFVKLFHPCHVLSLQCVFLWCRAQIPSHAMICLRHTLL